MTNRFSSAAPPFDPSTLAAPQAPLAANAFNGQTSIDTLIGLLAQPTSLQFVYDSLGNRTEDNTGTSVVYTSNEVNEYTSVNGQPYLYDDEGNLLDDAANTYSYDLRNHLVSVTDKASGTVVLQMYYDPDGALVGFSEGGAPQTMIINDGKNALEEYSNGVVSTYVNADGPDEHCSLTSRTSVSWFHPDSLLSTRLTTDSTGSAIQATPIQYDSFGSPPGGVLGFVPFLFTGKRYFPATGLYDSRARVYSPLMGRFLQRDPKVNADGLNSYEYAGNNPLTNTDRLGARA